MGTPIHGRRAITAKYRRRAILKKTRGRCYYCKVKLTLEVMTVEHLKPVYQGGTNDDENLVASCRSCNSSRGGLTPEEMLERARMKKQKMKKELTVRQKKELKSAMQKIGRIGGQKTLDQYGTEHYRRIALEGWKKRRANAQKK